MKMPMPKWSLVLAVLVLIAAPALAPAQEKTYVDAPGTFVRVGATADGWVTLGYRLANLSIGQEWMLLEVLVAVPDKVKEHTLKRTDFAVITPDNKVVPLATQADFQRANMLMALNRRADVTSDPINYVPSQESSTRPLPLFGAPNTPGITTTAAEQFEVTDRLSAFGRLFFNIPGGIQPGLHRLAVKFATTTVNVPFTIVGEDGVKELEEKIKEIKKQAKEKAKE